ncbi:MAG: 30S ribosomal protein S6 [Candidatus Pacebacteria bacterium]|nr:30S ribosomal protein S6 [Candidatus Paceibacterota bacterium]
MRNYELAYLISPDLNEEDAKQFQNRITSQIQEEGGILGEGNLFLKRRLAYPVKKQLQAYLVSTTFQLNPEKLASFEKKLKAESQILRYIFVIKRKYKIGPPRRRPITPTVEKSPEKPRKEEKKVELGDIEKKLDEILKEE